MRRIGLVLVLLLVLAGCGGSGGVTQTAQTESYQISLTLDSTALGDRNATVEVRDKSGQPASVDSVVLSPVMRSMGMLSPEITAQPAGQGRYQATPVLLSMTGEWEVDVRVSAGGKEEMASFKVTVPEQ